MQHQDRTFDQPLSPSHGVLVLDGFGLRVFVNQGHLCVEDGIGRNRRHARFSRATAGIKRLVLLGSSGFVTLEAIRWLTDVGTALIQIDRDGNVLTTSARTGTDDPRLRRAQALAARSPLGASIAREILRIKLTGQATVLERLGVGGEAKVAVVAAIDALDGASAPQDLMVAEAAAAVAYWDAWAGIEVPFVRADQSKVPEHWRTFGKRASPLTGNPRLAANPANALANYLYALLEAECRIACLAVGLDPGLGVVHADQRSRDSMALDVMEAARPKVDGYVLDLLQGHFFRVRDFHETRQGVCRVLPPLSHLLAGTAPRSRQAVAPLVERIAQTLADTTRVARLPTRLTEDNRSAGRDGIRKGPRPATKQPKLLPSACVSCGHLLDAPGRRYCDNCLPERREEAALAYLEAAHDRLSRLRAEGRDPSATGAARSKAAATNRHHRLVEEAWDRDHPERPSPSGFTEEILPLLSPVSLAKMREATGLSLIYCSQIRRGLAVPHPRHWETLRALAATVSDKQPSVTNYPRQHDEGQQAGRGTGHGPG